MLFGGARGDEYLAMFHDSYHAAIRHLKHGSWYIDAHMDSAQAHLLPYCRTSSPAQPFLPPNPLLPPTDCRLQRVAAGCRLQPTVSLAPQVTWPLFNSLQGFWPGMQLLVGEREMALDTMRAFHALWRHLGFHPEGFNLASMQIQPGQLGYPLRPEHVESLFWAHRTTHGGEWLRAGRDVLRSLQTLRVPCGVVCRSD